MRAFRAATVVQQPVGRDAGESLVDQPYADRGHERSKLRGIRPGLSRRFPGNPGELQRQTDVDARRVAVADQRRKRGQIGVFGALVAGQRRHRSGEYAVGVALGYPHPDGPDVDADPSALRRHTPLTLGPKRVLDGAERGTHGGGVDAAALEALSCFGPLADENPKAETISYDELIKSWQAN